MSDGFMGPPLMKTAPRLLKWQATDDPQLGVDGVGHANGQHDPAGLDRKATLVRCPPRRRPA